MSGDVIKHWSQRQRILQTEFVALLRASSAFSSFPINCPDFFFTSELTRLTKKKTSLDAFCLVASAGEGEEGRIKNSGSNLLKIGILYSIVFDHVLKIKTGWMRDMDIIDTTKLTRRGGSDKPVLFASSRHTVAELIEYHNSKVLS